MSHPPVPVAEGNGTAFQRIAVAFALSAVLASVGLLDTHPLALATMVPFAIALADFLSGFVHWAFDHHVAVDHRWLGRLAVDFLDHHEHPLRTLRVGFVPSAFRSTLLAAVPVAALALVFRASPFLSAFLYGLAVVAALAPQIHKLAHAPRRPRVLRWLQSTGVILSPRAHCLHHVRPHHAAYCIATGWCNPLLDGVGFWAGLDSLIARARWWSGRARAALAR